METDRFICPTCSARVKNDEKKVQVECGNCGLMITPIPAKAVEFESAKREKKKKELPSPDDPLLNPRDETPLKFIVLLIGLALSLVGAIIFLISWSPVNRHLVSQGMRSGTLMTIGLMILGAGAVVLVVRKLMSSRDP